MTSPFDTGGNELYTRLLDYCRYMYEEEKERTDHLNDAVKVYLGFTSFVIGIGVLRLVTADEIAVFFKQHNFPALSMGYPKIVGIALFCISVALFAISGAFTILVIKGWRFERLCNPEQTVVRSTTMQSETELLSAMIADFAIAANRNYAVNEKKAKLLSYGLLALMCALLLLGASWLFTRLLPLI